MQTHLSPRTEHGSARYVAEVGANITALAPPYDGHVRGLPYSVGRVVITAAQKP